MYIWNGFRARERHPAIGYNIWGTFDPLVTSRIFSQSGSAAGGFPACSAVCRAGERQRQLIKTTRCMCSLKRTTHLRSQLFAGRKHSSCALPGQIVTAPPTEGTGRQLCSVKVCWHVVCKCRMYRNILPGMAASISEAVHCWISGWWQTNSSLFLVDTLNVGVYWSSWRKSLTSACCMTADWL